MLLHIKYVSCGPHVFRGEDFFFHYKPMGTNDPAGRGQFELQELGWQELCRGPLNVVQFGHQGLDWQDLCRGPLNIAT